MAITYSDTTNNYKKKLDSYERNQPSAYNSQYGSKIDDVLNKIVNREQFSYDFNADPIYQQYKDQYTKLGKEAAMNAAASVSDLTGGYGSSYASTAASQANQQYLSQLNNVIPELYNAAMQKSQMDLNELTTQYSTLSDAENAAYSKYRDNVSDYYTNRDYYNSAYNNALSNDQWNANFAENQRQFNLNYALNKASAAAAAKKQEEENKQEEIYSQITNDLNRFKSYMQTNAGSNMGAGMGGLPSYEYAVKNYLEKKYQAGEISESAYKSIYKDYTGKDLEL